MINQYFSVAQVGEIIRDLLLLQSLADQIQKLNKDDSFKQRSKSGDEIVYVKVKTIPEEDQNIIDVLKLTDPALV